MFKMLSKILLIGTLLAAQGNSINAGVGAGDSDGFGTAAVLIGLGGIGIGGVGAFGLLKSFQWAGYPSGAKRYVGRGVLTTAGVLAILGLGYGMAKLNINPFK